MSLSSCMLSILSSFCLPFSICLSLFLSYFVVGSLTKFYSSYSRSSLNLNNKKVMKLMNFRNILVYLLFFSKFVCLRETIYNRSVVFKNIDITWEIFTELSNKVLFASSFFLFGSKLCFIFIFEDSCEHRWHVLFL